MSRQSLATTPVLTIIPTPPSFQRKLESSAFTHQEPKTLGPSFCWDDGGVLLASLAVFRVLQ